MRSSTEHDAQRPLWHDLAHVFAEEARESAEMYIMVY